MSSHDMATPTELSLCAGIGGISLGLRRAIPTLRTVCYVERELYAAGVLARQMQAGALDPGPIWSDLTTFDAGAWRGRVDIVTAGFPCQPHSLAGKRKGTADERWIFEDIARIIRDVGARVVFLENVPGLVSLGLDRVLGTLADIGFDAEWGVFSAAEVGAPHLRRRLFILATDPDGDAILDWAERMPGGRPGELQASREGKPRFDGSDGALADGDRGRLSELGAALDDDGNNAQRDDVDRFRPDVPDARGEGLAVRQGTEGERAHAPATGDRWWQTEPGMGRVANGIPDRVDRLRALGNAVVPATVELAWRTLAQRFRS